MEITKDPTQIKLRWFRDLTKINLKWFSPYCRIVFQIGSGFVKDFKSSIKLNLLSVHNAFFFGLYKVLLTLFASRGPIAVLLLADKRPNRRLSSYYFLLFFSFNLQFLMLSVFCNKVTSIRDVNDNVT